MNRRITQVAVAAAAAMALSLATPVSAQAAESGSATLQKSATAPTVATPSAITRNPAAAPSVTRLSAGRGTLYYTGNTYVPAAINYNVPDGWSSIPTARLSKSGRTANVDLFDGTSVRIPSAWGAGVYRVDNITFRRYDGTATHVAPNSLTFRVRKGLNPSGGIRIVRKGSKVTFKVQKIRAFNGARYTALPKATVQVKKGKKWKTLKTVKLNKYGSRTFKIKHKSKRKYRLYIKTTTSVQGGATGAIRI
ncbi:hypothetical protein [Aeromicrobium choanae]|uniref:Uncharacterized protein n=1 Tax=Aeromicrobium choanae TaxID=1736691 RepID=A0A1T4Z1E1_9ACTN|nr:hypothetical protein [Aeromicrobium choanae]SKB07857.1 hypothetical protein SAMN06295964_1881 [Aeromicrobium choanae]